MAAARTGALLEAFHFQAQACRGLGAPLAAALLDRAREDIRDGGPVAALLGDVVDDPLRAALPLRLLAGLHRLVLTDEAHDLAAYCASVGGRFDAAPGSRDADAAGDCMLALVAEKSARLRPQLAVDPQTNEVARSGALFGGFLTVWKRANLPLQLLELGASAGLNLRFDRYRYRLGIFEWGDARSPVFVHPRWVGDFLTPAARDFEIAERAGCDLAPIDVADPEQAVRLCSYVWPDDRDRFDRLRAAIDVARAHPVAIDRDDALDWLADRLADRRPGRATVVFHSVFQQYLSAADRAELEAMLDAAGREARMAMPLAWLRLEQEELVFRLRLRSWDAAGRRDELLAEAHPHGRWVDWKARGLRPMIGEVEDEG
ncbi:MAG: DUF2332 family protein [Myxococcota bacterium]|nr:DUF2332 domain-containing protein [Myxococcales bacterium]